MKVAEIEVPGLPETLFIVSGQEDGKVLMDRGIKRGWIWTNAEVERLIGQKPTQAEARNVAEAKMLYDAKMVEPEQGSLFAHTETKG